jgi:hypothetical protein
MPQGLQALLALLVLLPGFVSARIARALSAPSQQSELERIIEALIFSFFTYVAYVAIFGATLPVQWTSTVDANQVQHYAVTIFRWRLVFLAAVALALGFLWGVAQGKDVPLAWLRKRNLTVRTNRTAVWNDVFYSLDGSVQVGLADGRNVAGWLRRYSDTGDERSLFLERAAWILEDGTRSEIPGAGILLTDKAGIEFVMFVDPQPEQINNEKH